MVHLAPLRRTSRRRRTSSRCVTTEFNRRSRTRPGYPALRAGGRGLARGAGGEPVLRRRSDAGAQDRCRPDLAGLGLVTYPDQAVWANTSSPKLVAGESLSSCCTPRRGAQERGRSGWVCRRRQLTPALAVRAGQASRRGLHGWRGFAFVAPYLALLILLRRPADALRRLARVHQARRRASPGSRTSPTLSTTSASCRRSCTSCVYRPVAQPALVFVVGLALLLHGRASLASSTFRFVYYLPGALAGAAAVLLWLFVLDPTVSPGSAWCAPSSTRTLRRGHRAREPARHLRRSSRSGPAPAAGWSSCTARSTTSRRRWRRRASTVRAP